MRRKGLVFEIALFALVICAGAALVIFPNPTATVDDTPSMPGVAGGEISTAVNVAETNRKIIERVEVTARSVQNVLKTLARPQSYSLDATVIYHYGNGQTGVFYVVSRVRPDISLIELYSHAGIPHGLLKNTVLTARHVYVWESGPDTFYSGSAGDFNTDDFAHMPTYETILAYPPENVTGGGLDAARGLLLAETVNPTTGSAEKWQVDIDSGLLVSYQSFDGNMLVCEAVVTAWSEQQIDDSVFLLPNGQMPE